MPLRAWYRRVRESEHDREERYDRVVVELKAELESWLTAADPNDAIRVISGGPGSGKSSFSKMFAAHLAEQGILPVLFVPLHQFDPTEDLVQAIGNFIEYDPLLVTNPLQLPPQEPRRLIIFDGLDELAMQGKIAKEVSQAFVREVKSKLEKFNQRQTLLQVIISGREPAVQDNSSEFRKPQQILHLLPHFIPEQKREGENNEPYITEDGKTPSLLAEDRRQTWWQQYGTISGKGYEAMPDELDQGNLVEITAQPLLNYLVALSYDPTQSESFGPEANLNKIYRRLLDAVYERGYERQGTHRAVRDIKKKDFVRILEEVALAAWHEDGRTTTVSKIQQHFDAEALQRLLGVLEEEAEAGVTRLLLAFYFRQHSAVCNYEHTFEFTHKSFGEYLTACGIVRTLKQIHRELTMREKDPCQGWDARDALTHWVRVCGPSSLDKYLLSFLQNEIRLQAKADVEYWQMTLSTLFGFTLCHSMPMERLPLLSFRDAVLQAHHADSALLAVLNACALVTETPSKINWPSCDAMGSWLARIQGQRSNLNKNSVEFACLSQLDLSYCNLNGRDFLKANFSKSDLSATNLSKANLSEANLSEANLSEANLSKSDLSATNLSKTNLRKGNLAEANLSASNLSGTDLSGADCCGADFSEADLSQAKLRNADLTAVNLYKANLYNAQLEASYVSGADFKEAQGLTPEQVAYTIGWETAKLDNSLRRAVAQYLSLASPVKENI